MIVFNILYLKCRSVMEFFISHPFHCSFLIHSYEENIILTVEESFANPNLHDLSSLSEGAPEPTSGGVDDMEVGVEDSEVLSGVPVVGHVMLADARPLVRTIGRAAVWML
jgi:hypothetical protein